MVYCFSNKCVVFTKCRVSLPTPMSFYSLRFRRRSLGTSQPQTVEGYSTSHWGGAIYINYLKFFFMGKFSFLLHLLIYWIIYLYQCGLMNIYFTLWSIIQYHYCLLGVQIVLEIATGSSFRFISVAFIQVSPPQAIYSLIFFLTLFTHSLTLWHHEALQAHLCFPCLSPSFSRFLRNPGFFYWQ